MVTQSTKTSAAPSFGDSLFRFFVRDAPAGPLGMQLVSTAPVDVGRNEPPDPATPMTADAKHEWGTSVMAAEALGRVVQRMAGASNPRLIIQIHGYNNPPAAADKTYSVCWDSVSEQFPDERDLAWVGYRWPSERAISPTLWLTSWAALPAMLVVLLVTGFLLLAIRLEIGDSLGHAWRVVTSIGGAALVSAPLVCVAFRIVTYWRDAYRAATFGAPDLVEFIRQIDRALVEGKCARRVKLSLIGHSMGGYVATETVRILTDVLDPTATVPWGDPAGVSVSLPGAIGERLTLDNLVLVSPDIPAEALMTRRTNALEAALRSFAHCYLLSNGGDVVLSLISTAGNSFSFPAQVAKYGTRLGNVTVGNGYDCGLSADVDLQQSPDALWLLGSRVSDLDDRFRNTAMQPDNPRLVDCFTYFDFTGYRDHGVWRMSFGRGIGSTLPAQILCMLIYFGSAGKLIDPHSAYFAGPFGRRLIFGLCGGGDDFAAQSAGDLKVHRIKGLVPLR